jgi:hypothetical protein
VAEIDGRLVVRIVPEAVARVAVAAQMVGVVIRLEDPVMPDDPVRTLRHVRPQDRRREFTVIAGRKRIADIVQQGRDHHLLVGAIAQRPGRGLQPVFLAGDGIAVEGLAEAAEILQHAVGKPTGVRGLKPAEELVLLFGAVFHAGEADNVHCGLPRRTGFQSR